MLVFIITFLSYGHKHIHKIWWKSLYCDLQKPILTKEKSFATITGVGLKAAFALVAQLVEQRTENPRVGGSIPPGGTIKCCIAFADLAHLVERHLAKVEVASSSLVIRSKIIQEALSASWF